MALWVDFHDIVHAFLCCSVLHIVGLFDNVRLSEVERNVR